jgi:hypothetical protein
MSHEQAREIAKGGPEPGLAALENLVEESRTNQYWKVARAYSTFSIFPKIYPWMNSVQSWHC